MQTFYEVRELSENGLPEDPCSHWLTSLEDARRVVQDLNDKHQNEPGTIGIFRLTLEFVE